MCLDLCRFITVAQRRGDTGNQKWLGMYFKAPYGGPPHDFAAQETMLREYLASA